MEKILIVDDEDIIRDSLSNFLSDKGYIIKTADTLVRAKTELESESFDLILLDLKLPDGLGTDLLDFLSKEKKKPLVIMMTAYGTIGDAVKAIKKGAFDFIEKPFRTKDIDIIIKLALETTRLERELRQIQRVNAERYGVKNIIGSSKEMQEIFRIIRKVADKGVRSVLILGETGVGKELIAKAIHYESKRSVWPFVAVNCSSIPSNLLESELYGYERGAFTDAKEKKIGLLEKANKGTLFLDEIGDMNYELQSKLLRTLENRTIRRLGGTTDIDIDIQLIAATNQDINNLVDEGKFRKDLYYRLKVVEINVPPLRERKEDILTLAKFFLLNFNEQYGKKITGFTHSAEKLLLAYDFPGNVRELKNIMEKICLLEDTEVIDVDHLPFEISKKAKKTYKEEHNFSDVSKVGLEKYIEDIEKKIISEALKRCDGNKSEAAKLLLMDRSTLRYKIRLYNL